MANASYAYQLTRLAKILIKISILIELSSIEGECVRFVRSGLSDDGISEFVMSEFLISETVSPESAISETVFYRDLAHFPFSRLNASPIFRFHIPFLSPFFLFLSVAFPLSFESGPSTFNFVRLDEL